MMHYLQDYYKDMKVSIGVNLDYAIEKDDPENDLALKRLRPNCS